MAKLPGSKDVRTCPACNRQFRCSPSSVDVCCSIECKQAHRLGGFTALERALAKTAQTNDGTCWQWHGFVCPSGYGSMIYAGKRLTAHRVVYEGLVGPIPDGLVLDHLCRNRACVNHEHLEPVTIGENVRRGLTGVRRTHCLRGHAMTPDNIIERNGVRRCRTCNRATQIRSNLRRRKGALPCS